MAVIMSGSGNTGQSWEDILNEAIGDIDWASGIGAGPGLTSTRTGGGSSVPRSYYDALAQSALARAGTALDKFRFDVEKYNYESGLEAQKLARQQAGAAQQLEYLRSILGQGVPSTISGNIDLQEQQGRDYIQNQAAELLRLLQGREAASRELTQTGYSNLMNYLARNQPQAFAQAQRAMPTITESGLGQYMTGQGVSPAAAQEAATLANIQAAGGASNYNQLLNVLAAREQSAQASRQAEAEMGLAGQLATLQNIYGGATSGLEQQRLQALAQLSQQVNAARLQAQREAAARDQAIQDAIAAILASGLAGGAAPGGTAPGSAAPGSAAPGGTAPGGTAPGGTAPGGAAPAPVRPIDALAARMAQAEAAGNDRLANRIEDFIAANPNAGIKKIEREFPNIGAAIRSAQSAPATNFPLMGYE